jgi:type II secretory pathway component PulF
MLLCVAVIVLLLTFILPRFKDMFEQLDIELPLMTVILIESSNVVHSYWAAIGAGLALFVAGTVMFMRSDKGRRLWSLTVIRIPVIGAIVRSLVLARICRVWGQLLDSKVPMLDSIRLTQQSTTSVDFVELLERLEETISAGSHAAGPLRDTWLMPKTFAAAIAMGEESGRLSTALSFVATCLEEENAQVLASLNRILEPVMLVVMGTIVGVMAVSLFLPMFEMATAGH